MEPSVPRALFSCTSLCRRPKAERWKKSKRRRSTLRQNRINCGYRAMLPRRKPRRVALTLVPFAEPRKCRVPPDGAKRRLMLASLGYHDRFLKWDDAWLFMADDDEAPLTGVWSAEPLGISPNAPLPNQVDSTSYRVLPEDNGPGHRWCRAL